MFARSRLTRWNNRFARSYGSARFSTLTPQVVRDTWQDNRSRVRALVGCLPAPAYNRLVVDYWKAFTRREGITLVETHLAFALLLVGA